MKKARVIGLSGGICSGKSTITKAVSEKGIKVVDCDKLGHLTYKKGEKAFKKLLESFGKKIVDKESGEINRRELGKIVFTSKESMSTLTSIVWPEIALLIQKEIDMWITQKGNDTIVFEAAVLVEAKWNKLMNEIWIIDCPEDVTLERLMKRNNLKKEEAQKRMKSQISNKERLSVADHAIKGDASREEVKKQVLQLLK